MERSDSPAGSRPSAPADRSERQDVIRRAQEGDRSSLPQLEAMFAEDGSRLVEVFGNLASHAAKEFVARLSGKIWR